MSGVGSLITFQKDEGLLITSARTIQSAIVIHKAAASAAQTATPIDEKLADWRTQADQSGAITSK
jgi:hypothetical protein